MPRVRKRAAAPSEVALKDALGPRLPARVRSLHPVALDLRDEDPRLGDPRLGDPRVGDSRVGDSLSVEPVAAVQHSVLIVEADPELQNALARMISSRGHRVVGTDSAVGARALLRAWNADLVLVSDDLVGVDGAGLATELCAISSATRVVLMTTGSGRSRALAPIGDRLRGPAKVERAFRLDRLGQLVDALLPRTPLLEPPLLDAAV